MKQLPPIFDRYVLDNSTIDGRLEMAPSHFKENFRMAYLTEKMRCNDVAFNELCDRVADNEITDADVNFLESRVMDTDSEKDNENFKLGKLSIIVTTNRKREHVNNEKLETLLPDVQEYTCNSIDRVTNVPGATLKLSENERSNLGKTGNLPTILKVKVGAPVVVTSNHKKRKFKEDGIVNGARGYVQAVQTDPEDRDKVEVIWVVFHEEKIGRRYRGEHYHLRANFDPGHPLATPILPERSTFPGGKRGGVKFQRTNFPLSLAFCITSHKCQVL